MKRRFHIVYVVRDEKIRIISARDQNGFFQTETIDYLYDYPATVRYAFGSAHACQQARRTVTGTWGLTSPRRLV